MDPCCGNSDPCCGSGDPCCGDPVNCGGGCGVGKPISLVSGTEGLVRTDLAIGNLYPITIERRFNSRSSYDSPLGYGWALNLDKRLYTYPDGSVTLRKECGWKKRFLWDQRVQGYVTLVNPKAPMEEVLRTCTPVGNVDWREQCPDGLTIYQDTARDKAETLSQNGDGTYTITGKDGEREDYDVNGRLARKIAANGNSLVFTYEADVREPLWGLLPFNINQTGPLIVAFDYRLSRIEETNASGAPTGAWVQLHYESSTGWLTDITDSAGRTVYYTHDTIGNLVSVSGPNGSAAYGYYDANNRHLLTNIDEGQGEYVNTYDVKGRAIKQTHGAGEITIAYTKPYASATATTKIKDASGNVLNTRTLAVDFNGLGTVTKVTDAEGNVTVTTRDDHGWVTSEASYDDTNTPLSKTTYTYDYGFIRIPNLPYSTYYVRTEKGDLLAKTEAQGTAEERTTTWTYHPTFDKVLTETVKSVVDPAQNRAITNTYDEANGNLLTTTEAGLLGNGTPYTYTTTYSYDANGKVTSIDGPRTDVNDVTSFTYDAAGNLQSMTQPMIGTTTFSNHDGLGNPRTVTDPNGNSTEISYDNIGRVTSVKAPGETNPAQYFYLASACVSCGDEQNKLDHIILPEGNRIDAGYDGQGSLITIKDSQNNTITYTHDSEGNPLKEDVRDPSGALQKTLSAQYDALNRLTTVINPDTTFTQYSYDAVGNRKTAKEPSGNITAFNYDALNRLIAVIQPGSITASFEYNSNSKLTKVVDANNNATVYKHDDARRTYQVISPDTGTTTYSYDPAGNMIGKTDAKGITISYIYDALNRLTKIDFPSDVDIVYNYDNCPNGKGRLCSMTDASGTTVYEYTAKGQVKKETKAIDSIQYVTQYTYDQNGNMKTMTYPSGKVITYNYTNDRAVSVLNGAATIASNITYKPFGGMSSLTYGNGIVGSIGYDNQYRVTSITAGTALNFGYTVYDSNGNIKSIQNMLEPAKNRTFNYDALDRLDDAAGPWGAIDWVYDGVGNRQTENGNSYTYFTNTNKLSSANGISYGYDSNGNTTTEGSRIYTYNQNQRLIQVVNGAMTANYIYNGNGQRVKKNVNGTATIFHYSLSGQLIAESNSSGAITAEYVYLNSQPLAKIEGANVYYYHNDHLGTPQKMTDSSQVVVWSADYKPFGEATIAVSTITNNLRGMGQYFDQETGLHYNYFRDYNPVIGRYIESDPIGILRGENHLYVYVGNNPANDADPEGLEPLITWLYWNLQGPILVTDMPSGTTTFYPGLFNSGSTYAIPTSNRVTRRALPGANDPYSSTGVFVVTNVRDPRYGPPGAYINTGDPRGRYIHGGGSSLQDPYAPNQPLTPTLGCTRGHNAQVQALGNAIIRFQRNYPTVPIRYIRFRQQ